jgi:hypothetical protein
MDSHLSHIQTYAGFNMDLHSLATHLAGYEDDPAMTAKLVELQSRIDQAVIAEIHGEDVPGSGGIAIHFPKPGEIAFHPDDYSIVAFAAATRWDEILQSYCQTAAGCSPSLQELADKLREIARSQAQTVPRR